MVTGLAGWRGGAVGAGMRWLVTVLAALAAFGGCWPLTGSALERFLPWKASPEDLRTWAQPPPAG